MGNLLKKKNPNSQAIPHIYPIIASKGQTQALVFFKIPGVIPGCSQIICEWTRTHWQGNTGLEFLRFEVEQTHTNTDSMCKQSFWAEQQKMLCHFHSRAPGLSCKLPGGNKQCPIHLPGRAVLAEGQIPTVVLANHKWKQGLELDGCARGAVPFLHHSPYPEAASQMACAQPSVCGLPCA